MKSISITIMLALVSFPAFAGEARVIKDTLACENIGWVSQRDTFLQEGDEVAAKKLEAMATRGGNCRKIKAGTQVIFYHFSSYTDGDYGAYTTIRRKGDTRSWVVDKCALDGRDPDLTRFPGYVSPEKPCSEEGLYLR